MSSTMALPDIFFLQNISHVLKVRINAKMSDRVIEEMKRANCSEENRTLQPEKGR